MVLDLTALLSSAATGAVTGYLTNNLALNMIFKKYGPFGGVVIKTKEEFISSISELVERDIINHETLKEEFSREEFRKSLDRTAADFVNTYLLTRSRGKELSDFSGWEQNYTAVSSYLADRLPHLFSRAAADLKAESSLEDFLDREDLKTVIAKIYDYFLEEIKDKKLIKSTLLNLYNTIGEEKLAELLSENAEADFYQFLKKLSGELKVEKELDSEKEKELKNELKNIIDLEDFTANIYSELKGIKVNDIIKSRGELQSFFEENKLKELIQQIIINLKIEMENSKLIVDDLLDDEIKDYLSSDLENGLEVIKSKSTEFISKNKEEINDLIFNAVEEEIEASSGFKGMSRAGIYNKYRENIDEYGNPADLIIEYLNNSFKNNDDLHSETADKLKNIKISFLSSYLDSDRISLQIEKIIRELMKNNRSLALFDMLPESVIAGSKIEEKIYDLLFQTVKQSLADPEILKLLSSYSFNMRVDQIIDDHNAERVSEIFSEYLISLLRNNEGLKKYIFDYFSENLLKMITAYLDKSKAQLSASLDAEFQKKEAIIREKKIEDIYKIFQKNQSDVIDLTDFISRFLYSNLPGMLEGRIAQAASANLNKLSDQEVQKAIEEFMGTELKPITYLGALLGAAAGLLFSLSGAELYFTAADPIWLKYLSSALLYGGVGWLTNVLAIWMIFHPYQEKQFASFKIPFTPGVVAKNKGRFALSMGDFVEKELLKSNSAAELIENNREEIISNSLEYCRKNDFEFIFNLFKKNDRLAAAVIYELMKSRTADLNSQQLEFTARKTEEFLLRILKSNLKEIDYQSTFLNLLEDEKLNLNLSVESLFDSADIETIGSLAAGDYRVSISSARFKKIINDRKLFPVFKHLLPLILNKNLDLNIKQTGLELFEKSKDSVLKMGKKWLYSQQENTAKKVNFKKDELLEKEKEKKGGLLKNTLISGALYMADLDEFVDAVVKIIFEEKLPAFLEHKDLELVKVLDEFVSELQNMELESLRNNVIADTLTYFLSSDKGQKLFNEIIYLSEEEIEVIIAEILNNKKKKLFDLKFSISEKELKYFIKNKLSLEQKLNILLSAKKLFSGKNLERELSYLLKNNNLSELNQHLKSALSEIDFMHGDVINAEQVHSFLSSLKNLFKDEKLKNNIEKDLAEEINNLADYLDREMETDGLEEILRLIIESGIDSLKVNSEEMLDSLNLKELTAEEVKAMDPAEIEAVFDSFAGKYFSHLKQYGWFGGVFGILQILLRSLL